MAWNEVEQKDRRELGDISSSKVAKYEGEQKNEKEAKW